MGSAPRPSAARAATRWVGAGHACDPDPAVAAERALADALGGRDDARLLLAFTAAGYPLDALADALSATAPGVPLAACAGAGRLSSTGAGDESLVVAALGGPGLAVSTVAVDGLADDPRGAGIEAAAALGDVAEHPHRALLLLADGLAGDAHELVRGTYAIAGAGVPLVGGCATGGVHLRTTGEPYDGRATGGAIVAAAIGSDAPLGVGVRHGWRPAGEPLHVTRSEGAVVFTLDDRPALDAYLERLGAPASAHTDAAAFAAFARACPLGLRRRAAEPHVRAVLGADLERRTLRTAAELPQGGVAWPMVASAAALREAATGACADALAALGGRPPRGLLAVASAARRALVADAQTLHAHAGGAPFAGFHGHGEIARARGVTAFHEGALAVLAVA